MVLHPESARMPTIASKTKSRSIMAVPYNLF